MTNKPRRTPSPVDRCGRTGKVRYKNKRAAIAGLTSAKLARRHDPRRQEQRVYSCLFCGGFHLSSQPINEPPTEGALPA